MSVQNSAAAVVVKRPHRHAHLHISNDECYVMPICSATSSGDGLVRQSSSHPERRHSRVSLLQQTRKTRRSGETEYNSEYRLSIMQSHRLPTYI